MKDPAAPAWLPDLIEFDWNLYQQSIERAYEIYTRDFLEEAGRPLFRGKRMGLKRHPTFDGKDATFWHFVTEGKIEDKRTPDRSRIERIAWPRAILVELNAREPRVFTWRDNRPGPQRWLVTLGDFSYLVVVEERSEYALPWTAYPVTHDHQRLKLRREYDAWQRAQKAGAASR